MENCDKAVSVLMSVYNETARYLTESVESILKQTMTDFEFIIVLDNPDNTDAYELLRRYQEEDNRIIILKNETNIGLAQSMNRAARIAQGKYIMRMDADDISEMKRMEIQYALFQNGCYDMICTNKGFINENSKTLDCVSDYYEESLIRKLLPYGNLICHPSIMIKKETFDHLKGYRDFKFSQDYDLWLRMLTGGYRIFMIPEKLVQFRIRSTSVSAVNRVFQVATSSYAKKLYRQRKHSGQDSFSYEDMSRYLLTFGIGNKAKEEKIKYKMECYSQFKDYFREKKYCRSAIFLLKSVTGSKYFTQRAINAIRRQMILLIH